MIRVLITDDYRLWRIGVRTLLERENDINVVGEARDGQEAIEMAEQLSPDVILMDIKMPRVDGLEATGQIRTRQPHSRVVVFAMSWDEPLVRRAIENGASGYLPKDSQPQDLVNAIHAVYESKTFFDPRLSNFLVGNSPPA